MSDTSIPLIDLNDYKSSDEDRRCRFIKGLGDALVDIGFFAITNHGVDRSLIDRCYRLNDQFFRLPEQTKKKYEFTEMKGQRGYISFGKEQAKTAKTPDLKEFWHVGRPSLSGRERFCQNIWPDEVKGFQENFEELYAQLDLCGSIILEACALYLGLPKDRFSRISRRADSILRLIHYPPVDGNSNPAAIRAAAHEDINLITLLCESTASGLELLQRDGSWRPIPSIEGHIIGDAGDMLQNITNGYFKSTTHRVVNPCNSRERRFSMPFFLHPDSEADLTPLDECVQMTGGKMRFPSISAGEYLSERLAEIGF